ncbi:prolipoprotein diacylglyceryl transferase [Paractinoplanes deccanensis]|uniref:Phosphatidylglycerol--prolipoprotein diacylglyceryl transferase n=1 Tax=Paractinoplanes deccanensis TaxID=113561 RepID=A0ABQ3YGQ8_9ACTN|nr:prolipoprotein diacylglyceryl transferase [Actinoplanes deccanensis]GID79177.1 prolipoprotein diacylglyceryl transferase [Actinoplanes deccanensis]
MIIAAIPSPTTSVWHVLGLPVRAYALCIVLGIVAAVYILEYRMRSRGVARWASLDIAVWAVPFGIIGARIYHLITSPQDYFGAGGDPIRAFYIWEGGLGIWGAVLGGALGAYIGARQLGIPFALVADSLAVGLPVAQGIGRLGNWFNNELYGKVTTLPWGLEVHDMDRSNPGHATVIDGQAVTLPDLYHPTFLYELIWDLGVALLVWLADRKFKFGRGRAFALYVMAYTAGRAWIEMLRVDEANHFFGVRLNVFTAIVFFVLALIYFLVVRGPRAYVVPDDAPESLPEPAAEGDVSQVDVTGAGEPARAPKGYQVVSHARFEAYRRTGILPPETPQDMAEEIAAGGDPLEPADPAGPAGVGEAVLATGAQAGTGPDGASGGDIDVESQHKNDER